MQVTCVSSLLQGVMVRLMLVLAPVMCILSGIAVSAMLVTYMKQVDATKNVDKKARKFESNFVMKSEVNNHNKI
jgi:dolichyl-diphosphooligosaccharide--protein glycosyltransferase